MTYMVHSIFLTCQGEGANIGRVAVFVRFAGCNLWSGRERDRARAVCQFCDTQFRGGEGMSKQAIVAKAVSLFPGEKRRFCVLTGGEPLLQVTRELLDELKGAGFSVAIETNGTMPLPGYAAWVCVSPKAGTVLALKEADELKLVFPQQDLDPEDLSGFHATHRWLSPVAGVALAETTAAAAAYCLAHPEWRLAIQAHKTWGLP